MTPPDAPLRPSTRTREILLSVVRIQSVVAMMVGGSLAILFAFGGLFGRVAYSLAGLLYGLTTLAWATRAAAPHPNAGAGRTQARNATARRRDGSGRVVPFAGARRSAAGEPESEVDSLAGR